MSTAYEEARQALRYAMKNMDGGVGCTYEEMGILRFLLAQKRKDGVSECIFDSGILWYDGRINFGAKDD